MDWKQLLAITMVALMLGSSMAYALAL